MEKKAIKASIVAMVVVVMLAVSSAGIPTTEKSVRKGNDIYPMVMPVGVNKYHPIEKKIGLVREALTPNSLTFGEDIPIITTESDDSHPAIATDGAGGVLVMSEISSSILEADLGLRYSPDGGNTWYPEDGAFLGWATEDALETYPRIDYTGGSDFQAYGTNLPDPSTPVLHLIHFPSISDPEVSWEDDSGWTIWSVDLTGYYEDYDGIDVCGYPYGDNAPYPNFHGIITSTCIDSDTGLDTISLVYETEGTGLQLLYWPGIEGEVSHATCDIDLSTGEYFQAVEWKDEPDFINDGVHLDHCYLEPGNPEWWKGDWPEFIFEGAHNPDVKADGGNCYLVYEFLDPIYGATNIVCAYSNDNGQTFKISNVTQTPTENEKFPAVTAIGTTVICTYYRNGDLYTSTSKDGGATWEESDEPINDDSGIVTEEYRCADIANQYITWEANNGDNSDIFFDTVTIPGPALSIESISGGFGVTATVSNTGSEDASNVDWTISFDGGVFVGKEKTGTVTVPAGGEATVKTGFIFGFGKTTASVNVGGTTGTASGFVLGPLVLGVE